MKSRKKLFFSLSVILFGLVDCVVAINPELSDVENPSESSDEEDPTLEVTDGGKLGRGLPCQGGLVDVERPVIIIPVEDRELVVLVVGRPGSFARGEANSVELK